MRKPPFAIRLQHGFGAVAAIVVLVILAAISAAVIRLSTSEQGSIVQQLQAARALQAAQAGIEWGLFKALRSGSCSSTTLDLSADLGMHVSVSCSSAAYNEGLDSSGAVQVVHVYTIDAVACNSSACPDATMAVTPNYVERRRQVSATDQ